MTGQHLGLDSDPPAKAATAGLAAGSRQGAWMLVWLHLRHTPGHWGFTFFSLSLFLLPEPLLRPAHSKHPGLRSTTSPLASIITGRQMHILAHTQRLCVACMRRWVSRRCLPRRCLPWTCMLLRMHRRRRKRRTRHSRNHHRMQAWPCLHSRGCEAAQAEATQRAQGCTL